MLSKNNLISRAMHYRHPGDPLMASYPHQVVVPPPKKKGIHGVVVVVVVVVVYASVPAAADILAK